MSKTRIHAERIVNFKDHIERSKWIELAEKFISIKNEQIERWEALQDTMGNRDPIMAQTLGYCIEDSREEIDMVERKMESV